VSGFGGKRMSEDTKTKILIILLLVGVGALVMFACIYQITPTQTVEKNITVVEKYSVQQYTTMCGGGKAAGVRCTQSTLPKVVDISGDLYMVDNEQVWARMKINESMVVYYSSYPNTPGRITGIKSIGGMLS
jgi:hypothetical protein